MWKPKQNSNKLIYYLVIKFIFYSAALHNRRIFIFRVGPFVRPLETGVIELSY